MANLNQKGFTLIEIILVTAISGALLGIAFMGQGQLRAQAHFDAGINKVVSTINKARNSATAGVNDTGQGKGQGSCPGAGPGEYIFAGVAWTVNASGDVRMDYYKAVSQSSDPKDACVFATDDISLPVPVQVTSQIDTGAPVAGATELFIRSNDLLYVCPVQTSATATINAAYRSGVCPEGKSTLDIKDADGRNAVVEIDKSGLAQRKS